MRVAFLLGAILFSGPVAGQEADAPRPRGNAAVETLFRYAYDYMGVFLREALILREEVQLDAKEVRAVQDVLSLLKDEKRSAEALDFEKDLSDFSWYEKCGALKLAYTFEEVGTPIRINSSILYKADSDEPNIAFPQIVAILFHELGHHAKYQDHLWLQGVGVKVAKAAETFTRRETVQMDAEALKRQELALVENRAQPLAEYRGMKREVAAGMVLPYSTALSVKGSTSLYFFPHGSKELLRIAPISTETKRISDAINLHDGYLPFSGQLEFLKKGIAVQQGSQQFLAQGGAPDTIVIVNIWPTARNFAIDDYGEFFQQNDKLYVVLYKGTKDANGKYIKSSMKKLTRWVTFLRPEFERALLRVVKLNGSVRGIFYLTYPINPDNDREVLEIATYILNL